jgi:hypothetical protein
MGQQQEAIAALLQGEAADPDDSAIAYARATIHARLGQNQKAIAPQRLRSSFARISSMPRNSCKRFLGHRADRVTKCLHSGVHEALLVSESAPSDAVRFSQS